MIIIGYIIGNNILDKHNLWMQYTWSIDLQFWYIHQNCKSMLQVYCIHIDYVYPIYYFLIIYPIIIILYFQTFNSWRRHNYQRSRHSRDICMAKTNNNNNSSTKHSQVLIPMVQDLVMIIILLIAFSPKKYNDVNQCTFYKPTQCRSRLTPVFLEWL